MRRLLLVVLVALLVPVAALAARAPKPAERAVIAKAIVQSVKGNFKQPGAHFIVKRVRISTRDAHYAAATVTPLGAKNQPLTDTATVVLAHKTAGWRVIDLGTDQVGCTRLSKAVIRDLFGAGYGCQ
jgi:hypothetical protein